MFSCSSVYNEWRSCDIILEDGLVNFAILKLEIHSLMIQIRILSMILQTFSPTLHNPNTRHTRASYVEMILTMVMIVHHEEQAAKVSSQYWKPPIFYNDDDDDDEESSIPLRCIISELPLSVAIAPDLPIMDSLIMKDEHLNTIPETESDKENESSVKDLNLIPSEFEDSSEDLSDNESECDVPVCDDFSLINVYEEKFVTFSNPLFNSNDYFTSSDDESLSDEDVPEDNVKIYSNPLFEFDDEYICSDVNPFFDEVLENIESKDSYVSNLDELTFLVTPLSDFNEDECFDPGGDVDEIELLLHRDPSTPKISVASILEGITDEPPLE
ncbi:hypothetical protein Tco_1392682 [Tanacetum coccineum]